MISRTADLCDTFEEHLGTSLHIVTPMFQRYGGRPCFSGQMVTLKIFEDNSLVRPTLGENGTGKVLVIDGGGSLRCALLGDQLAKLAVANDWAGVVVYGCIRDSAEINTLDLGVRALATHPQRSAKKGAGERGLTLTFGGVDFVSGQYLYADEDGILVSERALSQ